jgi:hypothetical protein
MRHPKFRERISKDPLKIQKKKYYSICHAHYESTLMKDLYFSRRERPMRSQELPKEIPLAVLKEVRRVADRLRHQAAQSSHPASNSTIPVPSCSEES